MSKDVYTIKKIHPVTGQMTECQVLLRYFQGGGDAFKFKGETLIYDKEELEALAPTH